MLTVTLDPELTTIAGGEKQVFPVANSVVKFGRALDCAVRFLPSDSRLGRNHFELRPAAASYELVTDRVHPVFINGERVVGTVPLLENTELRLIDPVTGPKIKLVIAQTADGALTDPDFKSDSGTLQQGLKHAGRLVAGLAVLVALIGGFTLFQWRAQEQAKEAFLAETAALIEKLNSKPERSEAANWTQVYDQIKGSVYQVALLSNDGSAPTPQATAWVSGSHTLVTNAHVAMLFAETKNNQTLVVMAPDGSQVPIRVRAVKVHPAYLQFREQLARTEAATHTDIKRLGSYDVAVLSVDTNVALAKPLQVANAETLQQLRPGEAIAYVGYPAAFAKNANAEQLRIGYISGSTDFLGVANDKTGELIYHTAPATGGASGSPIVNSRGEVIAIHSGGETRGIGSDFVVSGSGTFYAQSAALLEDLSREWTAGKMASTEAEWQNASLYLAQRNKIWALLQNYRDGASLDRLDQPPAYENQGILAPADAKSSTAQAIENWSNVDSGTYLAFAVSTEKSERSKSLSLRIASEGTSFQSPLYLDEAPTALFKIAAKGDVSFAIDGAAGENYWLQVIKLQ